MKRCILTGAPGAGKTTNLRQLELDGLALSRLRFERIQDVYREWGFELIRIEPAPILDRVRAIRAALELASS